MGPRGRLIDATLFAGTLVLVLLAARADLDVPAVERWQVAADLIVGIAFVVVGRVSPIPVASRGLFVAVGAAWLFGSFVPDARLWHQSVLAVALVTFPTGRPRSFGQRLVVAIAVVVLVLELTNPVIAAAATFGVVAAVAAFDQRADRVARGFTTVAAALVGAVLYGTWHVARSAEASYDPAVALSVYEASLLVVATMAMFAARAELARRTRLVDRFLSKGRLVGLEGLEAVLGDALGDPTVRVHRWGAEDGPPEGRRWLSIFDGDVPIAVVEHWSGALDDPATAGAVSSAVRLALTNLDLQTDLDDQLAAIDAARGRLVAAGDRQRESMAVRLRLDVLEPLDGVVGELRSLATTVTDPDAADALTVVVAELTAATTEIGDHVAGIPAAQLGGGRLIPALHSLASGLPIPVDLDAPNGWSATAEAETALFYACSEALANTIKHSRATRASIVLRRSGARVQFTISDDGLGGANANGSGLLGLADRLATRGGRLQVESPPGAGTTLTATVIG
jgi:signal transduction histidine kinase